MKINVLATLLTIMNISQFSHPLSAQTYPVYLSFSGYEGNFYIDSTTVYYYPPKSNKDTLLQLTAKSHTIYLDGQDYSAITFNLDNAGNVSGIDKPVAAFEKDTTIKMGDIYQKVPRIIFNTSQVSIDPSGAEYSFSAFKNVYPRYITTKKTTQYILVKGLGYFIATEFGGCALPCIPGGNYTVPELFTFDVDAKGNVRPHDSSYTNLIAATYNKNTLTFNTLKVTIDPKELRTPAFRMPWGIYYSHKTTFRMIRGLGMMFLYHIDGKERWYYFVPM